MNELITDKLTGIRVSGVDEWWDIEDDHEVSVVQMNAPNSLEPIVMIQVVTPGETFRFRAAYVMGFRYKGQPIKTLPKTTLPEGK